LDPEISTKWRPAAPAKFVRNLRHGHCNLRNWPNRKVECAVKTFVVRSRNVRALWSSLDGQPRMQPALHLLLHRTEVLAGDAVRNGKTRHRSCAEFVSSRW